MDELLDFIDKHDEFVILGHEYPDGDCVGSALVLAELLRDLGKTADVASAGPFEEMDSMTFQDEFYDEIDPTWQDRAVIFVDCASFSRTGFEPFGSGSIAIDHHPTKSEDSVGGFIDTSSPSTTLLIARLAEELGLELTKEDAELLMLGFCTDTGCFRFLDGSSGEHIRVAADLVDAGASPNETVMWLDSLFTLEDRMFLAKVMGEARLEDGGRIVMFLLPDADLELSNRLDTETLNRMFLGIEGVEATVLMRVNTDGSTQVGMRSKGNIDVGKTAQEYGTGGGGHKKAAGFTTQESIEDCAAKLLDLLV